MAILSSGEPKERGLNFEGYANERDEAIAGKGRMKKKKKKQGSKRDFFFF